MYLKYFGLSEASFSITPDPQYLYLGEQHREALAHLLYGAGENGGFVLLTGEVGTGKTTICRAFLEQTPEQVEVALVLNPAMTAIELMHAICQEFGVTVPNEGASVKGLVDRLNGFLLEAHARGRHPVLIIDEAQNLCPRVLEQVRLLTNLETAKHKLLQIFLIGQPELRALLASRELRQLNQRITARFHLAPLAASETAAYIDHRIRVAGVERPLFTNAALREVHRRSRGVPRLINLICDRALLGAAVTRRLQVTPRIVRRAARELLGDERPALPARRLPPRLALTAAMAMALGLGAWFGSSGFVGGLQQHIEEGRQLWVALQAQEMAAGDDAMPDAFEDSPQQAEAASATEERRGAARGTPAEAQAENQAGNPADGAELAGIEATQPPVLTGDVGVPEEPMPRISLARLAPPLPEVAVAELPALMLEDDASIPALLQVWGYEADAADCAALPARGLECERTQARWSDLRRFDRPAALRLMLDGEARYALVTALDDEFAILQRGERRARVPIADLDERWSGDLLMLWRLPPSGTTLIGPGSAGESVLWLREQLAALPDAVLSDLNSPRYDAGLRAAVRAFQVARGLQDDGIAGPRTLMLLNNALSDRAVPRLSQSQMDKP